MKTTKFFIVLILSTLAFLQLKIWYENGVSSMEMKEKEEQKIDEVWIQRYAERIHIKFKDSSGVIVPLKPFKTKKGIHLNGVSGKWRIYSIYPDTLSKEEVIRKLQHAFYKE